MLHARDLLRQGIESVVARPDCPRFGDVAIPAMRVEVGSLETGDLMALLKEDSSETPGSRITVPQE